MSKGQLEVIQVASPSDRSYVEYRTVGELSYYCIMPTCMVDGIRLHLVGDHKERKAAKKATAYWKIVDKGPSVWLRWQIVSSRTGAEIAGFGVKDNAKNYAKKLNKAAFEEGASQ